MRAVCRKPSLVGKLDTGFATAAVVLRSRHGTMLRTQPFRRGFDKGHERKLLPVLASDHVGISSDVPAGSDGVSP